MRATSQQALTVAPRTKNALSWRSRASGPPTKEDCGVSLFRAHQLAPKQWHVNGFRKSCGRIGCSKCHDQVARKETKKALGRLNRAIPLSCDHAETPLKRWVLIVDPGRPNAFDDDGKPLELWWTNAAAYVEIRGRVVDALKRVQLKAWVMAFHCEDDQPDPGCPWHGHFHVLADGDLDLEQLKLIPVTRATLFQTPIKIVRDRVQLTSPVGWLSGMLRERSSWVYRRSIQRVTYGGLAAPSVQGKKGFGGAPKTERATWCSVCSQEIERGKWFRATPKIEIDLDRENQWSDDGSCFVFEHPEFVGWGPPVWIPVDP